MSAQPSSAPVDTRPFITVSQGSSGWFAVRMWWNDSDLDFGFWEPWSTGDGRYVFKDLAIREGKAWAQAEGLEFRE